MPRIRLQTDTVTRVDDEMTEIVEYAVERAAAMEMSMTNVSV